MYTLTRLGGDIIQKTAIWARCVIEWIFETGAHLRKCSGTFCVSKVWENFTQLCTTRLLSWLPSPQIYNKYFKCVRKYWTETKHFTIQGWSFTVFFSGTRMLQLNDYLNTDFNSKANVLLHTMQRIHNMGKTLQCSYDLNRLITFKVLLLRVWAS
jgi:hypothetical protein